MEIITKEQYQEFESFVSSHRAGSFMQSIQWTKVKSNWGHECVISRDPNGKIQGAMLVLIRKLPIFGKTLLYAPRGPVCDLHRYDIIADLLEGVKILAKKYKSYLFRMDPYILADDDEFISEIQKMGFAFQPHMPDFTTFQIRNNYMLDIEGKTEEELLAHFHSKWRYNIRLAARKGVVCDYYNKGNVIDEQKLDEFYELMKTTGDRDGFIIRPKEYFRKMLLSLGEEHCRLYMCYKDSKALSGAVTTQYAGKTSYVYGASANEARNLMPNHLMQWTMIQWAVENGDFVYDFQGIPNYDDESSPNYGVYRFKKGFNGQVVEFAGEFDYVFSKSFMKFVDFAEHMMLWLKKVYKKFGTSGREEAKKRAEQASAPSEKK